MEFWKSFEYGLHDLSKEEFDRTALDLFRYQAEHCSVYNKYIQALDISIDDVNEITQIPYLPISFFKTHEVKTSTWESAQVFRSSGTIGVTTSRHHVRDLDSYLQNTRKIFEDNYGSLRDYHFLALLPSYLERDNSSLVFMMDYFIRASGSDFSGFYLDETEKLAMVLEKLKSDQSRKTVLVGVTFALLDLIEEHQFNLPELIVMETGGMKGRRKEMIRSEVHELICKGFNVPGVHSEYGMTELFSQAYSSASGVFQEPKTLKVLVREVNDPMNILPESRTGGLNIIDLANVNTCAFIETQDIGRKLSPNTFEVLGRFDNSDIRGCSLMTV